MNYQETAKKIVEGVGGKSNINSVYHCITRLRFNLKDNDKADKRALEGLDKVMGTNIAADQYQVIIGNDVSKVFDALVKEYPELQEKKAAETSEKKSKNAISRLFDFIASVFASILPAIAGAGLLKGFIALFVSLGWMTAGSDTYRIISAIGDGVFHYLPMLIAFSAARKFNANPFVAAAVSMALMYPDITTLLSSGDPVSFLGIPVTPVTYASSVIPILLSVWLLSYVEKGFNRIIPASLKLLFVPLLSLLVVVPITLIAIGPLGTFVGDALSGGINWLIIKGGLLSGIVLGGAMALIVMTGMHYALVPVILGNLATAGFDKFLPLTYISNMGQAGATVGVFFRAKDKKLKSLALSTSLTALMGVTEPAMYGVNMRYKKPFLAAMIGSAAGGGFALMFGVNAYVLASNGGIPGIPAFIGPTFWYAIAGMAIAFVVSLIASVILGINEEAGAGGEVTKESASDNATNSATSEAASVVVVEDEQIEVTNETIVSPMQGKAIPLTEMDDPTFGEEMMGKGVAFVPVVGELVSPVNGTVKNVFKTKHSLVIRSEEGAELLIHVGINTVKLRGQYFEAHVKAGDVVRAGDKLLTFDLVNIAKEYDITTAMVVTNTAEYTKVEPVKLGEISMNQPVLKVEVQ
ncbi:beta-glucoside-specific PTS transporter subunit IIABC [Paenibacillus sp. M1]|uniref:Beta-glucoside-specific PTS transporter subunit IIABC n=1 Tax=Paenibacillus haidiansis TaxID=1574488 RepID=A0ABU7VQX6_9BACL